MPCIEISLPKTDPSTKSALAAELTRAFCQSTPFEADILGIIFHEYEPGCAAEGGKLVDAAHPYLHLLLYTPRLKRSWKQALVKNLTQAFVNCWKNAENKPVIHICEHPYDNVGVNGQLLSDAYEECGKRSFYYDLPKD